MHKLLFELTAEEANLILVALGKLPLEQSLVIWDNVRTQAQRQLNPPQPTTTVENSS